MSKKQTSIEWLYERLERMIPRSALYNIDKMQYFDQAKAMHKEEIIEAYWFGSDGYPDKELIIKQAEQYYNETYGKE